MAQLQSTGITGSLTVTGDSYITSIFPTLYFTDTDGDPDYYISAGNGYFRVHDNTNSATRLHISSTGNVGIGTTIPLAKVDISAGREDVDLIVRNAGGGHRAGIALYGGSADISRIWQDDGDSAKLHIGHSSTYNSTLTPYITMTTGGDVGIGTTSPNERLHVNGKLLVSVNDTAYTNGYFTKITSNFADNPFVLESRAGTLMSAKDYGRTLAFYAGPDGSTAEVMRVDESGKVGIGTTTPPGKLAVVDITASGTYQKFHVGRDIYSGLYITDTDSTSYIVAIQDENASGYGNLRIQADDSGSKDGYIALGHTTSGDKMTITSDGNVGIGTTTPGTKLHTEGAGYFTGQTVLSQSLSLDQTYYNVGLIIDEEKYIYTKDNTSLRRLIGKTSDVIEIGQAYTSLIKGIKLLPGTSNGYVSFYDNDTEYARFQSGSLGIGTTDPSELLEIDGGTDSAFIQLTTPNTKYSGIKFADPELTTSGRIQYYHGDDSLQFDTQGKFTFEGGNVGIGTTSPSEKLHIDGNVKVTGTLTAREFHTEFVSSSIIYESGSTKFGDTSDDIHEFTGSVDITGSLDVRDNNILITSGNIQIDTFHEGIQWNNGSGNYNLNEIRLSSAQNMQLVCGGVFQFYSAIQLLAGNTIRWNNSDNSDYIYINNSAASGLSRLDISDSSDNKLISINSSGNIGIGTTSPASKLEVQTGYIISSGSGAADLGFILDRAGLDTYHIRHLDGGLTIYNFTDDRKEMSFDGAGKVGIGTTSPTKVLQIGDGSFSYTSVNGLGIAATSKPVISLRDTDNNVEWDVEVGSSSANMGTSTSHNLNILTANTPRIFIGSTGLVGIGTTSPSAKLHIVGANDLTGNYALKVQNSSSADILTVTNDGKIGIENTSPSVNLELGTDGTAEQLLRLNSDIAGSYLRLESLGNIARMRATNGTNLTIQSDGGGGYITNWAGGSERMRINYNGNVGIGTSAPKQQLHIAGGSTSGDITKVVIGATGGNAESHLFLAENFQSDDVNYGYSFVADGNNTNNLLIKNHNNSISGNVAISVERASGNVGIGTSSPTANLHSMGADGSAFSLKLGRADNGSEWRFNHAGNDLRIYDTDNGYILLGIDAGSADVGNKVGIGAAIPVTPLHIKQDSSDTGINAGFTIEQSGSGDAIIQFLLTGQRRWVAGVDNSDGDKFKISSTAVLGSDDNFVIDTSGNVGIGTTSPQSKLVIHHDGGHTSGTVSHTNATIDLYNPLQANTDEKGSIITFSDNYYDGTLYHRTTRAAIKGGTDTTGNTANGFLAFYTDDTAANSAAERMRIDKNGNVGIGTTSPLQKLHLQDGTDVNLQIGAVSSELQLKATNDADSAYIPMILRASEFNILSGNVGIGTTTPNYLLDVEGAGAGARVYNTGGSTSLYLQTQASSNANLYFGPSTDVDEGSIIYRTAGQSMAFTTNTSEAMRIDSSGRLGIGTTTPSEKLDVVGLANINDGSNNVMISSGNTALTTGTQNTTLGHRAGLNLTTGARNTAIGKDAMYAAATATANNNTAVGNASLLQVTGDSNVGIGINAGYKSGVQNVAVGAYSLDDNTGNFNVSVGYGAMGGAVGSTASNTVAVGFQALYDLTTGAQNTAVGYQALLSATTANNNTAIGYEALEGSNTSYNTAVGAYSLQYNTAGERNTAVGWYALAESSGSYNVSLGMRAGQDAGSGNTSLGYDAGRNTTGDDNVIIGREAGFGVSATSSFSNTVAVGYRALYDLTTGISNTAVGYQAGFNNSTGNYNTAGGYYSLRDATESVNSNTAYGYNSGRYLNGSSNTAIGYETLSGTGVNSGNTAVGWRAGKEGAYYNVSVGYGAATNTVGNGNTVLGFNAAVGDATSDFDSTVAVGREALYSLTTGNNNTAIGYQAGTALTTGQRNVLVGYQAGSTLTTESNKLYIENSDSSSPLIYGEFDNDLVRINGTLEASGSLTVEGSGSTLFEVNGSEGQLFSITDSLSGSLFAVSDVSGLPILEVFSDDRIVAGAFNNEALVISGSHTTLKDTVISGSLQGSVTDITPTNQTASLDCSLGNFFTLTLSSSADTLLTASNIQPGQSINLRITQPATSGSLSYGSEFKFPNGLPYSVSATGSVEDILSFIAFDSTALYGSSLKNFQ